MACSLFSNLLGLINSAVSVVLMIGTGSWTQIPYRIFQLQYLDIDIRITVDLITKFLMTLSNQKKTPMIIKISVILRLQSQPTVEIGNSTLCK